MPVGNLELGNVWYIINYYYSTFVLYTSVIRRKNVKRFISQVVQRCSYRTIIMCKYMYLQWEGKTWWRNVTQKCNGTIFKIDFLSLSGGGGCTNFPSAFEYNFQAANVSVTELYSAYLIHGCVLFTYTYRLICTVNSTKKSEVVTLCCEYFSGNIIIIILHFGDKPLLRYNIKTTRRASE